MSRITSIDLTHIHTHFVAFNADKTTADFMDSTCEYIAMRHLNFIKHFTFQKYYIIPVNHSNVDLRVMLMNTTKQNLRDTQCSQLNYT